MHASTILIQGVLAAAAAATTTTNTNTNNTATTTAAAALEDGQSVFNCSLSWVSGAGAAANRTHPKDFGGVSAKLPIDSDLIVQRTMEDQIIVTHRDKNIKNNKSNNSSSITLSPCCHWPRHCVSFLAGFADEAATTAPNLGTEAWQKQICCVAALLQVCEGGPVSMIGSQMVYELRNERECSAVTWEGEMED